MKILITGETSVLAGNAIRKALKGSEIDIVICDEITPEDNKIIVCCGHPIANVGIDILEPFDVKCDLSRDLEKWQSKGKRKMPKMI